MSYDEQAESPSTLGAGALKSLQGRASLRSRISFQKKTLVEQIKQLERLEKLLDDNPAIEEFQDLIGRTPV